MAALIPIKAEQVVSVQSSVAMARRLEDARMRLMMVLYSMIGTALAGSGVIAVLTMGYDSLWPIIAAAVVGAVVALPVAWVVAKQLA